MPFMMLILLVGNLLSCPAILGVVRGVRQAWWWRRQNVVDFFENMVQRRNETVQALDIERDGAWLIPPYPCRFRLVD